MHRRKNSVTLVTHSGDVMVSTGMWNKDKRAVAPSPRKKGPLNINAKNNNNFALAA